MLDKTILRAIAAARLKDAQILFDNARYDGASYICGYAVELALKARICDTLNWPGYPETKGEFQALQSFKIHDLESLLHLSGIENAIKQHPIHFSHWSIVNKWNPEMRYRMMGAVSQADAQAFIASTKALLPLL